MQLPSLRDSDLFATVIAGTSLFACTSPHGPLASSVDEAERTRKADAVDESPSCDVETIAERDGHLGDMARTKSYVYWTENSLGPAPYASALMRVAKSGGEPETLHAGTGWLGAIGTDEQDDEAPVFVGRQDSYERDGSSIWRFDPGDGTFERVVADLDRPMAIALDGDHLVWADQGGPGLLPGVRRMELATGEVVVLSNVPCNPRGLAVDADYVYFHQYFGDGVEKVGAVHRVAKDGSEDLILAGDQPYFGGLAVDDSHVYWTSHGGSDHPHPALSRVAKDGSGYEALVGEQPFSPAFGPALAGEHAYWLGFGGALHRTPLGGGTDVEVAETHFGARIVEFDAGTDTLFIADDGGSTTHPFRIAACHLE